MKPAGVEEAAAPHMARLPPEGSWSGVGSGWSAHGEVLRERLGSRLLSVMPDRVCESRDIAILAAAELAAGRWVSAEQALPLYLRDRVTAGT
jgi:tRNA threonylcarbamoyladenosine biosynthesis protein TsaB